MQNSRLYSRILLLACLTAPAFLTSSCVSSEETGSGAAKAVEPQKTVAPIDTPQIRRQAAAAEASVAKSTRKGAKFLAKSDTLTASLTKKPKANHRTVVRPDNPAYTIQIGAFSKAQNALRLQKIAKERFTNEVVLNNYDPSDKLYRVSLGKFDARKEASQLRREIMEKFPDDYAQCWVNYISK